MARFSVPSLASASARSSGAPVQCDREAIGLPFVVARPGGEERREGKRNERSPDGQNYQPSREGGPAEPDQRGQGGAWRQQKNQIRTQHEQALDGDHAQQDMVLFPMTELVRQDGEDLRLGHLRQQRVEQHDALLPPEAGKIGIGMRAAARGVHREHAPHVPSGHEFRHVSSARRGAPSDKTAARSSTATARSAASSPR